MEEFVATLTMNQHANVFSTGVLVRIVEADWRFQIDQGCVWLLLIVIGRELGTLTRVVVLDQFVIHLWCLRLNL